MNSRYSIAAFMGGVMILGLSLSGETIQPSKKGKPLNTVKPAKRTRSDIKSPSSPPKQRQFHPKNPIKALPDLEVEKIWLDRQNIIHLALKNKGKGVLSTDGHARGKVRVSFGKTSKIFDLKTIDPSRVLRKSGGVISFCTNLSVSQVNHVEAKIFWKGRISEVNSRNNILSVKLTPKFSQNVSQTKIEKSIHKVPTAQPRHKMKPELFVEKIYLQNGEIHLLIKNKGHGKISSRDYKRGRIVLQYGEEKRSWRLKDMDPAHRLDRHGGKVVLNTKLRLKPKPAPGSVPKVSFYDFRDTKTAPMKPAISFLPWAQGITEIKIAFTHPSQGDRLTKAHDYRISWYCYSKGNLANIILMEDETPITILASYVKNSHGVNFYKWHIPHTCPVGPHFKIRLESVGGSIMGESGNFEITQDEKPDITLSDLKVETTDGVRWLSFKLKNANWEHAKIILANPRNFTIQTCAMWKQCLVWAPLRQREIDNLNQRGYVWIRFPWDYKCDTRIILNFGNWIEESDYSNNTFIFKQQGICGSGAEKPKIEHEMAERNNPTNFQAPRPDLYVSNPRIVRGNGGCRYYFVCDLMVQGVAIPTDPTRFTAKVETIVNGMNRSGPYFLISADILNRDGHYELVNCLTPPWQHGDDIQCKVSVDIQNVIEERNEFNNVFLYHVPATIIFP